MRRKPTDLQALKRRLAGVNDARLEQIATGICEKIAGNDPETDIDDPVTRARLVAIRRAIGDEQDRRLTIKRLNNAGPRLTIRPTRGKYNKSEVRQ